MILKFATTLSILLVLCNYKIIAQSTCQEQVAYQTRNLGDGKEFLSFPLTFQFIKDSLTVFPPSANGKREKNFMAFKILSKSCDWTNNFTEGKSDYNLLLVDNGEKLNTKLNIVIQNKKGKIILQYEGNAEPRVFEINL